MTLRSTIEVKVIGQSSRSLSQEIDQEILFYVLFHNLLSNEVMVKGHSITMSWQRF